MAAANGKPPRPIEGETSQRQKLLPDRRLEPDMLAEGEFPPHLQRLVGPSQDHVKVISASY